MYKNNFVDPTATTNGSCKTPTGCSWHKY